MCNTPDLVEGINKSNISAGKTIDSRNPEVISARNLILVIFVSVIKRAEFGNLPLRPPPRCRCNICTTTFGKFPQMACSSHGNIQNCVKKRQVCSVVDFRHPHAQAGVHT